MIMYALQQLIKRNLYLYFRDRSAVLFSLLSVFIVILLMLVFLGDMNKNELVQLITNLHGTISDDDANHIIVMWTIAGILSVNSFTVPVTMIGMFVKDKEDHKLESLYTAPISRGMITSSYLISSILCSLMMCILILFLSFLYVTLSGYAFLTIPALCKVICLMVLNIIVSSTLVLLVAQWVKSDRAWGAFSTLAGTLIGFVGGIYLPMGLLPQFVQTTLKAMPFIHESALLREIFTNASLLQAFQGLPAQALHGYQEAMGIVIYIEDTPLSHIIQIIGLLLCGIIALIISTYLLRRHSRFDR